MEVHFRTNRLRCNYQESAKAIRQWGKNVGRKYVTRIKQLYAVKDFQEARNMRSMRLHALKGPKSGKLSVYLTGKWRLIVTMGETEEHVIVEEVSNHYGD